MSINPYAPPTPDRIKTDSAIRIKPVFYWAAGLHLLISSMAIGQLEVVHPAPTWFDLHPIFWNILMLVTSRIGWIDPLWVSFLLNAAAWAIAVALTVASFNHFRTVSNKT